MKLKPILYALILTLPFVANAQESTLDKVTLETCACMSTKDVSNMERSIFEQELGLCMLSSAAPYMDILEKEEGISTDDQASLSKLGEKVGSRLAAKCPDLLQKMMELYADEGAIETQTEVFLQEEGVFSSISQGQFANVLFKGADGKTRAYLWLETFEGSEILQGDGKLLAGKKAVITFQERSFFDPKSGGYQAQKVIKEISWQ